MVHHHSEIVRLPTTDSGLSDPGSRLPTTWSHAEFKGSRRSICAAALGSSLSGTTGGPCGSNALVPLRRSRHRHVYKSESVINIYIYIVVTGILWV